MTITGDSKNEKLQCMDDVITHGSLFSGIGGFDLAAEWMGWENVFHCEWNEFGKKVLNYYWPKAISYDDIKKTDFTIHRGQIDVLSGGFPCQPYSQAGKRKGKEDERHLWPEMLRAIREIQPSWVVGENVFGLINWSGGLVFDEVQSDLEAAGYEVWAYVLPACAKNAPHRRDRVWFIAYCNNAGTYNRSGINRNWQKENEGWQEQPQFKYWQNGAHGITPNTDGAEQRYNTGANARTAAEVRRQNEGDVLAEFRSIRNAADTCIQRPQRSQLNRSITSKGQIKREIGLLGQPVCSNWEQFPTQSPIRSGNDGLSTQLDGITFPKWRNESIKAYGNAIVPQVAHEIFKAIEAYTKQYHE